MEIHVQSIHFDADVKLLTYLKKKVEKVASFFDRIESAEIYLKLDKDSEHKENKVVEIKLLIPGHNVFAKVTSSTFEAAADSATEALKVQVKRTKEKLRERSTDVEAFVQQRM